MKLIPGAVYQSIGTRQEGINAQAFPELFPLDPSLILQVIETSFDVRKCIGLLGDTFHYAKDSQN